MNPDNLHKKSIVIFDDDEDILAICSVVLKKKGWQVKTFTDCRNVVERVAGINPNVIIMDNWLPDDGGIIATRVLKAAAQVKHIPIIFFTANSDIKTLAAAAGADAYLAKPFELEELERLVNTTAVAI